MIAWGGIVFFKKFLQSLPNVYQIIIIVIITISHNVKVSKKYSLNLYVEYKMRFYRFRLKNKDALYKDYQSMLLLSTF